MNEWFSKRLLDRFLKYVKINTASDRHKDVIPSTERQWVLIRLLESELKEIGVENVEVAENGYIIARIPASEGIEAPVIGFMAHVDTSEDESGENVIPRIWKNYDGKALEIGGGITIDPEETPQLKDRVGDTIITASGKTLLGADDKAGVAEIMTAVEYLLTNPQLKHGKLEIIFTPDEETGKGLDLFPLEKLESISCYTLDGDEKGFLESECFNAYLAIVKIAGKMIHPGSARGKLVNAITAASRFLQSIPQAESPEAADGRYGFYFPQELKADASYAELEILIRDFDPKITERRIEALQAVGTAIEKATPGSKVEIDIRKQYLNMREYLDKDPRIMDLLRKAVEKCGVIPREKAIRGGTDGSRLSEMGIPTPNIFTGGLNFHSKKEWASLEVMILASRTIVELVQLWAME